MKQQIISKLFERDQFSRWLGIEVIEIKSGFSKLQMKVRDEMLNGFGIAHGGIVFSLADTAFAFACNNSEFITVALDVSVSFPNAVKAEDELTAIAREINVTHKTGLYLVEVFNQNKQLVGLFKGTCYKTSKPI